MIDNDELLWVEKYRPHTIQECILPERLKAPFLQYVDSGEVPNLLLFGGPGVGKTTVARALCDQIGLNYLFINASQERGIDLLRNAIQNYASTNSLTGGRKVIILDEADYLTGEAQAALRGAVEEYSNNCSFILTCNLKGKLIDALHSRMPGTDFRLVNGEKKKMAVEFFKRLSEILKLENVPCDPKVLGVLVDKYFPDYRRCIGELQRLSTFGEINEGLLPQLSDVRGLQDLVKALREQNFTEARKWVVDNGDVDAARIFRKIYDGCGKFLKKASVPQCVVILARYQFQSGFTPDQELNLVACLTEIMVECEFE